MTKREWKIIQKVLQPNKPGLDKFAIVGGFYYATDRYRLVRCEEGVYPLCDGVEIPIYIDDEKHPDYIQYMRKASMMEYEKVEIPYTAKQIRLWADYYYKINKLRRPFNLGAKEGNVYIGINPYYLADCMETCRTSEIHIPNKYGEPILISGNDYTWLVMPIALLGYDRDKKMTEICEVEKV